MYKRKEKTSQHQKKSSINLLGSLGLLFERVTLDFYLANHSPPLFLLFKNKTNTILKGSEKTTYKLEVGILNTLQNNQEKG